jgi:hypothetical protein
VAARPRPIFFHGYVPRLIRQSTLLYCRGSEGCCEEIAVAAVCEHRSPSFARVGSDAHRAPLQFFHSSRPS